MKVSIYNLSMEKIHTICDEPLKIIDVNAAAMTISIDILANAIMVTENKLQIDNRLYDVSINDYQYVKVE